MKCREIQQLLIEDLDRGANAEIKGHLEGCPQCQELRDYLMSLADLNRSLADQTKAPVGFRQKVIVETEKPNQRFGIIRYAAPLAAFVILLAGIGWNQSQSQSEGLVVEDSAGGVKDSLTAGSFSRSQRERFFDSEEESLSVEPTFFEVVVSDSAGNPYVVRIPSTIRVNQTEIKRGYLTYVSH